jgi:hypothetical protein
MLNVPESVVLNKKNLKILSPEGWVPFFGVNKITKDRYIHLKFSNGSELKCSEDHPLMTINGIIKAKFLDKKTEIETKNEPCFLISKRTIKRKIDLYDIVNSGTKHLYYSNGIVSHNCEFLGSTNTLISGSKLAQLVYKDPIARHDKLEIYEMPIKEDANETQLDHLYAITVDPSEGRNMDDSSFSVFDVSSVPYKQVAKYNSSSISPVLFPTIIYNTAKLYNNAYVLVEINNTPQIADTLHQDLEYENVVKIETGNKKAQSMGTGFGRGIQLGIKMSPQVKRIGCSNLKTLIENDKLIINDFDTISQLTTFVSSLNSFKAEEGSNDDIVMTLVLFAWMTTQQYFKEIVNHDLRRQMQLEMLNQSDEEVPSFGLFDDGLDKNYVIEGGDVWLSKDESENFFSFR